MKKIILGIETSCDETGMALVEAEGGLSLPKFKVLKSLVASQIKIHAPFGGVVPNLAKREHLKNLPILLGKIFGNSEKTSKTNIRTSDVHIMDVGRLKFQIQDTDLIAVTVGPGLEPALWTGITFAKQLYNSLTRAERTRINAEKNRRKSAYSQSQSTPLLVGTNHLEGHLYSFLLPTLGRRTFLRTSDVHKCFPAIGLIISGGHTILLLVKNLKTWKVLGETRDDAVGEAFDKVARLLRLPYPGGPALEKLAKKGNPSAIEFPRPMLYEKNPVRASSNGARYDFSFSGLKTSVLYHLRDLGYSQWPLVTLVTRVDSKKSLNPIPQTLMGDVAASFQAAAVEVLVKKTMKAVNEFSARAVILSGGVAANMELRRKMRQETRKVGVGFLAADKKYNTDNAVMIAAAGYMTYLRKKKYPLRANGNLGI